MSLRRLGQLRTPNAQSDLGYATNQRLEISLCTATTGASASGSTLGPGLAVHRCGKQGELDC